MQINLSFDSSVSGAPSGFTAAVTAVAQVLDNLFTNNITLTIDVGWGEVDGQAMGANALGESIGQYIGNWAVCSAMRKQAVPSPLSVPRIVPMIKAESAAVRG